ncbi:oligosaccharide flippase family protein [Dechloromonas sp. XY25]|uniref:Oligosaccharide flippase family protein n=1 Tax=Dechloromonas hankyongensis TaxID=2908002 RepID=A0ABS9K1R3_9RHOO|nr:oligosaccharide flippase family protein [Dechloromonas hankyongensis]MCG2577106.1 oligosaccharide flippase family protein [Dechloromonas hankyongensis]
MLIRHGFYYLLARGGPGALNFCALIIFSRLLSVEEYGLYSVAVAAIGLINVLAFQWLQLVLARFLPIAGEDVLVTKANVLALFVTLSTVVGILAMGFVLFGNTDFSPVFGILALLLALYMSWTEMTLATMSVLFQHGLYGKLLGLRSAVSLIVGWGLAYNGWGATAPMLGLLAGFFFADRIFGIRVWRGVRLQWPAKEKLRQYSFYGLPLAATFALNWVISSSDRLIIAAMLGEATTGIYSVGYDLSQQTLGLIFTIIHTAAYPLLLRALENKGKEAAVHQLRSNGEMIITIAMVSSATFLAISSPMVDLLVGDEFRLGVKELMPLIIPAAAMAGMKSFYFDLPFHLVKRSSWLVSIALLTAFINVVFNFILIPEYGMAGAAWATLVAYAVATFASALFAPRCFPMPGVVTILMKSSICAVAVGLGGYIARSMVQEVLPQIFMGIFASFVIFAVFSVFFNLFDVRKSVVKLFA